MRNVVNVETRRLRLFVVSFIVQNIFMIQHYGNQRRKNTNEKKVNVVLHSHTQFIKNNDMENKSRNVQRTHFGAYQMIYEIIIGEKLIKVTFLVVASLLLKDRYSRRCFGCGSELDIEDYFSNNVCVACGRTQNYEIINYGSFDLNACEVKHVPGC